MSDVLWWPNWYVTKKHAVNVAGIEGGASALVGALSLCETWVFCPDTLKGEWQKRRMAQTQPAECKNCLRELARSQGGADK